MREAAHPLLGMSPRRFLREYWQRKPLVVRGALAGISLASLAAAPKTPFPIPAMAGDEFDDAERGTQIPKLRSFAVMMRTIDISQAALARHQMAAYPPDVLIEVPRTACRSLDFHRATELIDLGHELASRALDRVEPEGSEQP